MQHVFIVNNAAGNGKTTEKLIPEIRKYFAKKGGKYEIEFTKYKGDATVIAKSYAEKGEPVRIYACGGDGTLNEVLNGVVGYDNVEMGIIPCGSGNDFVKYYGGKKVFWNLEELIDAPEEYIDLMRVGNKYAINATHLVILFFMVSNPLFRVCRIADWLTNGRLSHRYTCPSISSWNNFITNMLICQRYFRIF